MLFLLLLISISFSLVTPDLVRAEAVEAIEITGEGVAGPITLSLSQLEAMQQYEHIYSTINTWPTKRWYTAKGDRKSVV